MAMRGKCNIIAWDGAFIRTFSLFESEIPSYPGKWFGSMSRCVLWDSRDEYEFAFC